MRSRTLFLAAAAPRLAALAAAAVTLAAAVPAAALTPPPPKATPLGPELEISGPAPARRATPAVAAFVDGGFAVAWLDADNRTVRVRLVDRHNRAAPVMVVGQSRLSRAAPAGPDLAVLGDETLLVVWADGSCPPGGGPQYECRGRVFGRRYARSGEALGAAFAVSEEEGAFWGPHAAALVDEAAPRSAQRGFVVAWTVDHDTSSCTLEEIEFGCNLSDVRGRVWSSGGEPLAPFDINRRGGDEDNLGGVAGTSDGGFVAVWESWGGEASFFDVIRRRFDGAGLPLEDEVRVNGEENAGVRQVAPDVAALAGGGHVVAWMDMGYHPVAFAESIVVRVYGADGEPVGPEMLASHDVQFTQGSPAVAGGADGGFLVTWTDSCVEESCASEPHGADGSGTGVFASYFSWAYGFGEVLFDQALAVETAGDQLSTAVASDGVGGWVAAWVHREGELGQPTSIRARRLGFARPCEGLCLDGRFEVTVSWEDFQGNRGVGQPVVRGGDWGTFWFFHPDNVELAVKVLDARSVNGRFWVFAGALTNVEYRLQVTDTETGLAVVWDNPSGSFLSRADTATLVAANEVGGGSNAAPAPDRATSLRTRPTAAVPLAVPLSQAPCPETSVCLQDGRFELAATWRDFSGNLGTGNVLPLTADTAWVWFFHPGNPELVVKVLDGRPVNGHFWVFYGALSNVEFELTVTDRLTGERAVYANPSGIFASRGDTTAFPGG